MIFLNKILICIVASLLLIVTFPGFAYAYLDPGTGSYVLQILIATFFGALYAVKKYWHQIKAYLSRSTPTEHIKIKDE